jgi:hypothetical protein
MLVVVLLELRQDGPAESGLGWYRAARIRPHYVPVDGNAEGQRDLLRDPWTPPARVPLFHVDDSGDDFLAGPLGTSSVDSTRRVGDTSVNQRSMQLQQRGGFEVDRGSNQPTRPDEDRTQAGDHAIGGAEMGRPFSRTVEDQ